MFFVFTKREREHIFLYQRTYTFFKNNRTFFSTTTLHATAFTNKVARMNNKHELSLI